MLLSRASTIALCAYHSLQIIRANEASLGSLDYFSTSITTCPHKILRMSSKDRLSILSMRQQRAGSLHAIPEEMSNSQPHISTISHHKSHINSGVDTQSFNDLFDRFIAFGFSKELLEQQDDIAHNFQSPISPSIYSPLDRTGLDPKNTQQTSKNDPSQTYNHCSVDNAKDSLVVRNDSTGSSSYSVGQQSDYSADLSRHSSQSSIFQDTETPLTTKEPDRQANVHKQLPSTPKLNTATSRLSISSDDKLTNQKNIRVHQHSRSSSLPLLQATIDSKSAAELPAQPPNRTRGSRLSRAMADERWRSKSTSQPPKKVQFDFGFEKPNSAPATQSNPIKHGLTAQIASTKTRRTRAHKPITAHTAERVIYRIMCHLDSPQDLQSVALVSKGFYRTFQRNQSKIVSHVVFKTSRTAWETRMSLLSIKGSREFRLRDYSKDVETLRTLKQFILTKCGTLCRQSTIDGLRSDHHPFSTRIDDALWRIWTFSTLFGNTVGQTGITETEIDWLNGSKGLNSMNLGAGFGVGNDSGLSTDQLEDMREIWLCLQKMVEGFHARELEAKVAGVFDNFNLENKGLEFHHLREWTAFLLTKGLSTILSVSSCSFDQARILGLTKWDLPSTGQSRTYFLLTTIEQVYQDRVLAEASLKAAQLRKTSVYTHRASRSLDERQVSALRPPIDSVIRPPTLRIDTAHIQRRPVSSSHTFTNAQIRPDCDPECTTSTSCQTFPASPTNDPSAFYNLCMTSSISTRLGATLFPVDYQKPGPRVPFLPSEKPDVQGTPEVVDPVDKALKYLVEDLGFGEVNAKHALAMSDSGSGVNVEKAIELLSIEFRRISERQSVPIELPAPLINTPIAATSMFAMLQRKKTTTKSYCHGHSMIALQRMASTASKASEHTHARSRSFGGQTSVSISPISESDERLDTISPLISTPMSARSPAGLSRSASRAKAWKVLGWEESNSKNRLSRKKTVLGIDEYQARVERRQSMRESQKSSVASRHTAGKRSI